MRNRKSRLAVLVWVGLIALTFGGGKAFARPQALPAGFDDYAVFMATGTIPFAPHPDPSITGCGVSIFCDGDYFHQVIMGRDAAETAAEAQRAKDYFLSRFGVDIDALVLSGGVSFSSFLLDPRADYRAYSLAESRRIPEIGWVVRDGGFVMEVLDPAGVPLGGEFAGQSLAIPMGGLLVWGSYNILATSANGRPIGEVVFDYRSHMPMIANLWGELVVNCQLSIDDFAGGVHGGKAQGMGTVTPTPTFDGLTLSWRNVLTIGGPDLVP